MKMMVTTTTYVWLLRSYCSSYWWYPYQPRVMRLTTRVSICFHLQRMLYLQNLIFIKMRREKTTKTTMMASLLKMRMMIQLKTKVMRKMKERATRKMMEQTVHRNVKKLILNLSLINFRINNSDVFVENIKRHGWQFWSCQYRQVPWNKYYSIYLTTYSLTYLNHYALLISSWKHIRILMVKIVITRRRDRMWMRKMKTLHPHVTTALVVLLLGMVLLVY